MTDEYINITDKAVKTIGSLSAVARAFGFKTAQAVANWVIDDRVPAERVIKLCRLGEWVVTPHELRPDLYPNKDDALPGKQ